MSGSPRLELVDLRKSFGAVKAVDGVDIAVQQGEFLTLLGPSGAGKTMTLKMIAGFEQPSGGRVLIDGRDVSAQSPAAREVGVVFQHYALFPHMTVAENVEYPLRMRSVPRRERRARATAMLQLVRLEGLDERRPSELSGGQQQRVAVARALVFSPRVLLMDEPLGALDRALRLEMQEELRRIHRETGMTVVYVTHDQEEALALSDRVAVMRAGRVLQEGTPRELFDAPNDAFTARFFGECNLFPLGYESSQGTARWSLQHRDGGLVYEWAEAANGHGAGMLLAVRPRRIRLLPRNSTSEAAVVAAVVEDVVFLGESARVHCRTEAFGPVLADADPRDAAPLEPGTRIELAFDPRDGALVRP
jgi:putative spermidine/putrescine transport system ATP-binding protein